MSEVVELYRGLNLKISGSSKLIEANGIEGTEGSWKFKFIELLDEPTNILESGAESYDDVSKANGYAICACGDEITAGYYAKIHNQGLYPKIIKFKKTIDKIYVDPRDFLCTVFQFWDRNRLRHKEEVKQLIQTCFGVSAVKYFERAAATKDQKQRVLYCNLACHDNAVKLSHLKNQQQILGRHDTYFKSAFFVKAPISAEEIIQIYDPPDLILKPQVILSHILN